MTFHGSRSEIQLWFRHLDAAPDEIARLSPFLSIDEAARAARFRFDVHRLRYIAGRGYLREILAAYLNVGPESLSFDYNSFGKPALAGADLRFNLSHTGSIAVYAVTLGREAGVDIEKIEPRFAEERIPESYFSALEVQALRSLPVELQAEAFFLCWTRKEAYIKARAEGLSIPLDSFAVNLHPGEPPRFLWNGEGWSIASFRLEPGYAGAIVAEGGDWTWRVADAGDFVVRPETAAGRDPSA